MGDSPQPKEVPSAAETLRRDGFLGPVTLIGAEPSVPVDRPTLGLGVAAALRARGDQVGLEGLLARVRG